MCPWAILPVAWRSCHRVTILGCSLFGIRGPLFLSHKHWENVLLWHFNLSNTFVCNEDAWKWCSNYPIVVFFNIKIILLCTKYSLKIKLKVNTVDSSITRSGFRPKGNMIHLKTSKKKKENTIIERKIFLSGQKQSYKNLNFSRTCFKSVLCFPIWYGPSLNVYEHVWIYKIQCIIYNVYLSYVYTKYTYQYTYYVHTPENSTGVVTMHCERQGLGL